jgi:hypothetical protein
MQRLEVPSFAAFSEEMIRWTVSGVSLAWAASKRAMPRSAPDSSDFLYSQKKGTRLCALFLSVNVF